MKTISPKHDTTQKPAGNPVALRKARKLALENAKDGQVGSQHIAEH